MIPRATAVIALVALGLAGFFVQRGPVLVTPSVPLAWTTHALDAGPVQVEYALSGVEFLRATDADEPALAFAALRRGAQLITLADFNEFLVVERHDGRLWALGESQTEGPGPTLELLVSDDDGRTFEHRASVPKPHYLATFETWRVQGDDLSLVLSLDEAVVLPEAWRWPWWSLAEGLPFEFPRPSVGPGRFVLRSKNAGRWWRLER